jgi:hypothetical protein
MAKNRENYKQEQEQQAKIAIKIVLAGLVLVFCLYGAYDILVGFRGE